MLDRLVQPLVRTQVQLLAQTHSASHKLISMISQWLGYLGIQASVTHLKTSNGKVQISLVVDKPEQCSEDEWQKILTNINQSRGAQVETELTYAKMSKSQQGKVHRLLAYVIRAGSPDPTFIGHELKPRLVSMGLEEGMVLQIQSALKVPVVIEPLLEDLEPDIAAFVLSKAITIALIDQKISQDEDSILKAIYRVLEHKAKK